jgi:Saxitoxin biosynthesis operon protein SxtJ
MQWSDINFAPPSRMLRQFATLWTCFFLLLAGWQLWRHDNEILAAVFAGLALTIGPLGLAWPRLVRPVFVGWMVLAFPIGWLVSHAVLASVFFGLFTPLGLVFRLIGRDVLTLRQPQGRETYWTPKPQANDPARYFRQF